MAKGKVKLSLIADKNTRKATFKKRKKGMLKKINELATLCGVQACALIYSGEDDPNPEAWPSREGAKKVLSDFMEVSELDRRKKMYTQQSYLQERIDKEQAKVKRLHEENRKLELREFMFDLVEGKMLMECHYYDQNVIRDLSSFVDQYVNKLTDRVQTLRANGEPTPFPPPHVAVAVAPPPPPPPPAGYVNPVAVSDVASVTTPPAVYNALIQQYQNMNMMNENEQAPADSSDHVQYQQELVDQYQVPPANVSDHIQYQNMAQYQVPPANVSDHMAHQEQRQFQPLANVYDQNQHRFYGWNQDMMSLNHDLAQSSNQYPNQHQQFMNQWMAPPQPQQMSEFASVASMDDNYYRYHQLPIASDMPSTTTTWCTTTTTTTNTTTEDLSAPNTKKNVWPTRFGLN